ncbi:unnamed protein product [Prunus armeniaca]|uniref:Adenylate isopentenyltransferase n=1 Tax=Prunus armeniaca TaxID=36596 RepID=A0A6J5UUL6_PRUAR|nr:unnamed protein product [Prunus armeniaca]
MEFVHANGPFHNKTKVIFVLGSTGCGKTKLSIDLATRYNGEIINSDKIQVYKGLDIVTNKATKHEQRGILHHLLGSIQDPEADFTVQDFCLQVPKALDDITKRNRVPIIAGGSNTYIEALVEDPTLRFQDKYDCCFIWLDVSLPVLYNRVSERVDEMVDAGLVDELREMFVPGQIMSEAFVGLLELLRCMHISWLKWIIQQMRPERNFCSKMGFKKLRTIL